MTKFKNNTTITTNNVNIPSDTDEDSDDIPTDIPISSIRTQPHSTSNKDKKVYKKKIKNTMTKAASLQMECRIDKKNIPGALKKIISSIESEFNLPPNTLK